MESVTNTRPLICGKGLPCERTCPVMCAGRECPTVEGLLAELETIGHPWVADASLAPC